MVINSKISFAFFALLYMKGFFSGGEPNFSEDFTNERHRIASVTGSLLKISFVFNIKILLY